MSVFRRRLMMTAAKSAHPYFPADTPDSIRNSCILWYDIERQGCTNESMAENPVLKDLSGNRHDARCYNFAWEEESGISTTNYPNALVSDGVDDYCLAKELPLLTREKGYTVVARRKLLALPFTHIQSFVSNKKENLLQAFSIERYYNEATPSSTTSFGAISNITIDNNDEFTYQTSTIYNGQVIGKGSYDTSDVLILFRENMMANNAFCSAALYSLLLFNRDLTEDEINWVKTNLMGETTYKFDFSQWYSSSVFNGATIVDDHNIQLIAYGRNWNCGVSMSTSSIKYSGTIKFKFNITGLTEALEQYPDTIIRIYSNMMDESDYVLLQEGEHEYEITFPETFSNIFIAVRSETAISEFESGVNANIPLNTPIVITEIAS